MVIVIITIIITYLILISWTYHSLGNMEFTKKVLCIIILLLVIYISTYITFEISRSNIQYPAENMIKSVKNILVFIFTGINGIFVMPLLFKNIEELYKENIVKRKLIKKLIICAIILFILLVLECRVMANTQQGILKIIENKR